MKVVKAQEGTPQEFIKVQEIQGDMGETERMQLLQQPDGDVIVTLYNAEKGRIGSIEFCTKTGGGRYPIIAKKLRELIAELVALDDSPWGNTSEITTIEPVEAEKEQLLARIQTQKERMAEIMTPRNWRLELVHRSLVLDILEHLLKGK
ncbi:hypothetical protein LCGC14_2352960 [marine sediment metagenome]|uniref:Uncharacterized protein n=1 Tax=marine sediment metagenome TaxID=412755 RepID=A0A0F9F3N1_9ZZZZ